MAISLASYKTKFYARKSVVFFVGNIPSEKYPPQQTIPKIIYNIRRLPVCLRLVESLRAESRFLAAELQLSRMRNETLMVEIADLASAHRRLPLPERADAEVQCPAADVSQAPRGRGKMAQFNNRKGMEHEIVVFLSLTYSSNFYQFSH
jgi:hypothetical protein